MTRRYARIFFLFLYFSILGVIFTYPLVRYMNQGMPYTSATIDQNKLLHLEQGDYIQLFYYMWLFKDALLGGTPFFKDPYQLNVPKYGLQDHFNPQYLPLSLFYSIFAIPFGDIAGYNLLLLFTFPLAGFGIYALIFAWTRSHWASLVGSTIYVIYPYRVAHLMGGHPGGFTHAFIPWIVYFYVLALQKRSWVWACASGLSFLGLGMDEFHVAYYMPIFLGIFILLPCFRMSWPSQDANAALNGLTKTGLFEDKKLSPYAINMVLLGFILGLFLFWWVSRRYDTIWAWGLIPVGAIMSFRIWISYSKFFSQVSAQKYSLVLEEDFWSYLPFSLFLIAGVQFWYDVPGLSSNLALMVVALVFLIKTYQVVKFRKHIFRKGGLEVRWVSGALPILFAFTIPASLLAGYLLFEKFTKLSTSVIAGGRSKSEILLYTPTFSDIFKRFQFEGEKLLYPGVIALLLAMLGFLVYGVFRKRETIIDKVIFGFLALLFLMTYVLAFGPRLDNYFPLYSAFYSTLPHFDYIRVPTRILYLSFFFLAMLSAYGVKILLGRMRRGRGWVGILLSLAVVIDYYPASASPGLSLMPTRNSIYEHVRNNLRGGRILELPIWPGESSWSSIYQYYATRYRTPMINGYRPAIALDYVSQVFRPLSPMNVGEMSSEIGKLLREWDVRFVLVHEEAFPRKVSPFPPHFTSLRLRGSPFLKFIAHEGGIHLFEVLEEPKLGEIQRGWVSPVSYLMEGESVKRGKYLGLPKGSYEANFRIRGIFGEGEKWKNLRLELWDRLHERVLANRNLKAKDFSGESVYKDFHLPFQVQDYGEVEPRIYYPEGGEFWLDRVAIGFLLPFTKSITFEAEELFHEGEILADFQASSVQAVKGEEGSRSRALVYGPYRSFFPGQYTVSYRLRIPRGVGQFKSYERVATLRVTSDYGTKKISERTLRIKDFEKMSGYQVFDVNFGLEESADLEFIVYFEGGVELWVDRIELKVSSTS